MDLYVLAYVAVGLLLCWWVFPSLKSFVQFLVGSAAALWASYLLQGTPFNHVLIIGPIFAGGMYLTALWQYHAEFGGLSRWLLLLIEITAGASITFWAAHFLFGLSYGQWPIVLPVFVVAGAAVYLLDHRRLSSSRGATGASDSGTLL